MERNQSYVGKIICCQYLTVFEKLKMNQSQIYTAQEILGRHDVLRDQLHSFSRIVPDDQRIITVLHNKICLFVSRGIPVDMVEYETIFANLQVVFAEYDKHKAVQEYSDNCLFMIFAAVDMFGTKK